MRNQGYSVDQVAGQIRRWHPGISPTQARSMVKAAGNPIPHVTARTASPPVRVSRLLVPVNASHHSAPLVQQTHHSGGLFSRVVGGIEHEVGRTAAHIVRGAVHAGLDVAATAVYGVYYGAYYEGKAINYVAARSHSRIVRAAAHSYVQQQLLLPQAIGLAGDVGIDKAKHALLGEDRVRDEGIYGSPNPFHRDRLPVPKGTPYRRQIENLWGGDWLYLPGIHGHGHIDLER